MNLKEQIETIIERDNLRYKTRMRTPFYKKMILARILYDHRVTYREIASMFGRYKTDGVGDHSIICHWMKRYDEESMYQDFKDFEEAYLRELKILTEDEQFNESLKGKVLLCENYWQMRELQEELKKDLV